MGEAGACDTYNVKEDKRTGGAAAKEAAMSQAKVTFEPFDITAEIDPAAPVEGVGQPGSLLSIASANGIDIEHPCEGDGTCGLCCVDIEQGMENLSPPSDDELELIDRLDADPETTRLACKAVVGGDVVCRLVG